MSLSIGIVGLPNVGKSTLFKTLTKKQVDASNYPFCTIDPNIGVVAVPDERVDKLAELTKSAKKIYTTIEFVDIAGLVKGANKGEGLGNKFLANIRETDAIIYVLRAFSNDKIVNTRDNIDPIAEKEILDTELILKDLETVEKRFDSAQKEARSGLKEAVKETEFLKKIKSILEEGKIISDYDYNDDEKAFLKNYQLLTSKPRLYLLNGKDEEVKGEILQALCNSGLSKENNCIILDILLENEAADFNKEERVSLGMHSDSELDILIKKSYELLNLITFFTTGEDETRAWTLKKGEKAPKAGGAIHSDFEKCFIKADVINWQDLINAGGFSKAKEKGLIRTEGKEYIVNDGDVIEIKSNA